MNRLEFREEVKKSNLCPEQFENLYDKFIELQDENIKVLKEVHRICEKHGINYELAFGSLIGAVRDNGVIPWDYDIDILIPYREKMQFIDALKEDLQSEYYFQCKEIDDTCRHYGMRIAPKGYDLSNLHVDVFYYIGAPKVFKKVFMRKIQLLFQWRYYKKVSFSDIKHMSWKYNSFVRICRILLSPIPMRCIDDKMHRLCMKYDIDNVEYCVPVFNVYKDLVYSSDSITKTDLRVTDFGSFRIPHDYSTVLNALYGDYNKIFPLKQRLGEFLLNYNHLTGEHRTFTGMESVGRYYL